MCSSDLTGMPRDLAAIRDTLRLLPRLRSLSFPEPLAGLFAALPDLEPLRVHLDEALENRRSNKKRLKPGGNIRSWEKF